jgi:hypothetical protein
MSERMLFIPLTKVDEEKRLIYGNAASEARDRPKGETFDYDSSKPHILAWSNEFAKVTEGKSFGNLRSMHQNISAGKLTDITFDDMAKTIDVVAEVVDDKEWEKVCKGVYTGFSFGGKIAKRWIDGAGEKRYTAIPHELSLGDYPAIPTATFTLVKIGGIEEEVPFAPVEAPDVLAKRDFSAAERKTDAKSGAAMPDGSFPIENEDDLKNAVKAYGRAKDKDAAKAHIKKRAKALGLTKLLPDDWSAGGKVKKIAGAEDLKKYLGEEAWDVQTALNALSYLYSLYSGESQPDEPPEQAKDLAAAIMHIKSFIESEIREKDEDDPNMALNAAAADLQKTGKAISGANLKHVQSIHDHACSLGADCSGMEKIAGLESELAKIAGAGGEETLAKIAGLEGELAKTVTERDGLQARVAELEAMPEPAKGALLDLAKVLGIDKDQEEGLGAGATPDPKDPIALIKAVHAGGGTVVRR